MTSYLRVLLFVLILGAVLLAFADWALITSPKRTEVAPVELLPVPPDKPLLTDEEREWAREDGVAGFWFDGSYHVVRGLPSEYWEAS